MQRKIHKQINGLNLPVHGSVKKVQILQQQIYQLIRQTQIFGIRNLVNTTAKGLQILQ